MSDEKATQRIRCGWCPKQVVANSNRYCPSCNCYLCDSCTSTHCSIPPTRDHVLGTSVNEARTQDFCQAHSTKLHRCASTPCTRPVRSEYLQPDLHTTRPLDDQRHCELCSQSTRRGADGSPCTMHLCDGCLMVHSRLAESRHHTLAGEDSQRCSSSRMSAAPTSCYQNYQCHSLPCQNYPCHSLPPTSDVSQRGSRLHHMSQPRPQHRDLCPKNGQLTFRRRVSNIFIDQDHWGDQRTIGDMPWSIRVRRDSDGYLWLYLQADRHDLIPGNWCVTVEWTRQITHPSNASRNLIADHKYTFTPDRRGWELGWLWQEGIVDKGLTDDGYLTVEMSVKVTEATDLSPYPYCLQ